MLRGAQTPTQVGHPVFDDQATGRLERAGRGCQPRMVLLSGGAMDEVDSEHQLGLEKLRRPGRMQSGSSLINVVIHSSAALIQKSLIAPVFAFSFASPSLFKSNAPHDFTYRCHSFSETYQTSRKSL